MSSIEKLKPVYDEKLSNQHEKKIEPGYII